MVPLRDVVLGGGCLRGSGLSLPSLADRAGEGAGNTGPLTLAGSEEPQALLSSLSTCPEQEWKSSSPTCWRVLGAHHGLCLPDVEAPGAFYSYGLVSKKQMRPWRCPRSLELRTGPSF